MELEIAELVELELVVLDELARELKLVAGVEEVELVDTTTDVDEAEVKRELKLEASLLNVELAERLEVADETTLELRAELEVAELTVEIKVVVRKSELELTVKPAELALGVVVEVVIGSTQAAS